MKLHNYPIVVTAAYEPNYDAVVFKEEQVLLQSDKDTRLNKSLFHLYNRVSKKEKDRCEVSLIINNKCKNSTKSSKRIDEKILVEKIKLQNYPIVVIAAYGPNNDSVKDKKKNFTI